MHEPIRIKSDDVASELSILLNANIFLHPSSMYSYLICSRWLENRVKTQCILLSREWERTKPPHIPPQVSTLCSGVICWCSCLPTNQEARLFTSPRNFSGKRDVVPLWGPSKLKASKLRGSGKFKHLCLNLGDHPPDVHPSYCKYW